ncbi:MAG: carboxypeptidase-like regulatory domain-containing protein, partial [Anaerolineae bacterium]
MLKRIVMVTRSHPRVLLILLMLALALGPGIGRSALARQQDSPSDLNVEEAGLSGRVVDPLGEPVHDAEVIALANDDTEPIAHSASQFDGTFLINL